RLPAVGCRRSASPESRQPTACLLASRLAGFPANHFIGVLDAFALVRIGLAERTDFGGGLSDFLFVDAGDGDVAALGLDGDVDAFRDGETHRVRIAKLE